ncbi:MAG: hypothetical protein MUF13_15050, partial [Akkermansiaceae bacterium]|nr:hypothetical protein [Akkermansiaceae bacterium]
DDAASDVDLAVDAGTFERLPDLMCGYCEKKGWRLVQLFPHEDTALYGICVSGKDPRRVVALDVCSDYQRDGVLYIGERELLEARELLDWGGWRLPAEIEFRYRFSKAAAKGKAPESLREDLAWCPDEALIGACRWLAGEWRMEVTPEELRRDAGPALGAFAAAARQRRLWFRPRSWVRWCRRLLRPSGLIVEWGDDGEKAERKQWAEEMGTRYFRRGRSASWSIRLLREVARSSLLVCPRVPSWLKQRSDVFLQGPIDDASLVDHLAKRLRSRLRSG